jgi:hypothetical protein
MPDEYSWVWIERLFKKIPVPYPIVSLIVGSIIFSIYWLFSIKVTFFPWEKFHILEVAALSILIALQLAGIQYILNDMEKTFRELKLYPEIGASFDNLYVKLKHRFSISHWYYLLVAAVIVPFIIIKVLDILEGGVTFYIVEPTMWGFLLDIYNNVIGYSMLFLLAIILWIIFNITWLFNEMDNDPYRRLIKIDIFSVDRIGGLKQLRNFILKILAFYFICITLAIISYISPFSILSYESFFLIILLLVGVGFFIMGLGTIRKLLKGRIEDEINKINKIYERYHQRFMDIVSEGNYKDQEEELNLVPTIIENLHIERERILKFYGNNKGYDRITIIEFVISFIIPLVTFLQKLFF